MHEIDLILTLTGGLAAALVLGYVTHRLGLSPIVGYLLAGIAVGPFTPGIALHTGIAAELAEIGVILLMFGVGLHFRVEDLLAVRRLALRGALVQFTYGPASPVPPDLMRRLHLDATRGPVGRLRLGGLSQG